MDDNKIWEKLTATFCAVFGRDNIVIGPATTGPDIPEWDSLNHVQLILAVEADFGVRFKHAEVAAFENVGDMVESIKRHLKQ